MEGQLRRWTESRREGEDDRGSEGKYEGGKGEGGDEREGGLGRRYGRRVVEVSWKRLRRRKEG